MKGIGKTYYGKNKEASLAISIIFTLIALVPIAGSVLAQSEVQPFQLYCPAGNECFCTPLTGVWHVIPEDGGPGGFSINTVRTEADN
jgi:hypothetical protein